jgi:hypothetical protein
MTTNNKNVSFISVVFVVLISYLSTNIISRFNYLDLIYLLFIVACFFKQIYLNTLQR